MGQKVHPLGFRLGVSQKHISHWFIDNNHYSQLVIEDQFIRNFFYKKFPGIASINIKRDLNRIIIEILSANTRDLLMDGGKMTAKASLSSESQVNTNAGSADSRQLAEQSSVHSDQGGELDSSNKSQSQKLEQKTGTGRVDKTSSSNKNSVNNLCDQLLKELTIYRDTQLKKTVTSKWSNSRTRVSASDRGKFDYLSATDSTASVSSKSTESTDAKTPFLQQKGDAQHLKEFGMGNKKASEKAPLLHEIELFWTKVENPNTSAPCLAEFIVEQLEKRVPFRRVLKRTIQKAEEASVEGIKVQISGRLNGAEIARSERIHKGQVPLHTLRAKIEYNSRTAKTIYGLLGVKVWVFNGFADLNQTKLLT